MIRRALKRLVAGLALVTLAGLMAACGGSSSNSADANAPTQAGAARATATPAPEAKVTLADNSFSPAELTVTAGTKVVWEWGGANPHSVMMSGRASDTFTGSGKFERTFDTPGTSFPYQCGVHGAAMSGKVTVK